MLDVAEGYPDAMTIVEHARTTVVGSCREMGAVCGAALRYRRALPAARSATASRAPVVLVHGFAHNPSAWLALADRLGAEGFGDLRAVRYGWRDDVPSIAGAVADQVDGAAGASGAGGGRVHLVAHSLGGVAVRYWHDVLGGVDRAGAVVTLAAPHAGTPWTRLPFPGPGHDLHEGSAVSRRLAAAHCPHDRWTTIGGTYDMVVPGVRAGLPGARHVEVAEGHVGLLTSPLVADRVCAALLAAEDVDDAFRVAAAV